ncbi:MAG: vanadium-dependent haloperoxidase [Hyphomicrobiaceae bacterium]
MSQQNSFLKKSFRSSADRVSDQKNISRRAFLGGVGAASALAMSGCAAPIGARQSYLTGFVAKQNVNPVFYWTDIILQAVRDQLVAPPLATRGLAMGHVAGFLAANGADPRFQTEIGRGPVGADPEVAYGTACAVAIAEHFQQPFVFDKAKFLSFFPDSEAKSLGVAWGEHVGRHIVRQRTNDGAEPSKVNFYLGRYPRRRDSLKWTPTGPLYDAGGGPAFRPTFHRGLLPGFGAVTPWCVSSPNQFGARNFLDPRSPEFADEFAHIKEIGASDSRTRTEDQSEIALFWEDGPWGASPPGHFALIGMQLLQHQPMNFLETARAMALMSMAQADSAISVWHSKFAYDIVRPETAIRYRAETFDNPDPRVVSDPNWKSYIPTPPFPTYVSGHSAFGASSTRILQHVLGGDDVQFSGPTPDLVIWPKQLTGVVRRWRSLSQASHENGMSRIYGGVHWNIDNVEALRMGNQIADHVFRTKFPAIA